MGTFVISQKKKKTRESFQYIIPNEILTDLIDMPHWISVQRSPQAFSNNDLRLLVLLVTLLGSIYDIYSATIFDCRKTKQFTL